MVIMAMSENETADVLPLTLKIPYVRHDQVHPIHLRTRKPYPAIHDDNIPDFSVFAVFIDEHILRHIPGASQGNDPDRVTPGF